MSDSKIPGERRQERSEETKEAIRLQLKHVNNEYGFEFLAVGDSHGYYIAGAGEPELDEALARFAPKIFEADDDARGAHEEILCDEIRPESEAAYIEVRKFPVRGMDMFICAVSPRRDGVDKALEHCIQGIQRISGEGGAE